VGFNSEIQGYNFYPMLHFHRKFSSGVTLCTGPLLSRLFVSLYLHTTLLHILLLAAHFPLGVPHFSPISSFLLCSVSDFYLTLLLFLATLLW